MFAPLFYAWERRLHAHSKDDRTVRPFDWGLDWLGRNGHAPGTPPEEVIGGLGPHGARGFRRLLRRARHDGLHVGAGLRRPARGAREPSSFRAASPHPTPPTTPSTRACSRRHGSKAARRTAGGRCSCSRSGTPTPTVTSACAGCSPGSASTLSGSACPTTTGGCPPAPPRADYIVSANVVRTVQVCRQAVVDARRAIAWLAARGLRADRHPRDEPGLVPRDADLRARAADPDRGPESRLPLFRRRRVGGSLDVARARRARRPHHARSPPRAVDADQPAGLRRPRRREADAARLRPVRHDVSGPPLVRI